MATPSWIHCLNPACPLPQRQLCTCPTPTGCRQSCVYFVNFRHCICKHATSWTMFRSAAYLGLSSIAPFALTREKLPLQLPSQTKHSSTEESVRTHNLLFCSSNNAPRAKARKNGKQRNDQKQNYTSPQPWRRLFCRYSGLIANTFFFFKFFFKAWKLKLNMLKQLGCFRLSQFA